MKTPAYKRFNDPFPTLLTIAVLGLALLWSPSVSADRAGKKGQSDPIRITADRLDIDNQKRSAQFSGNVKATQGNTVITAKRLTIFYSARSEGSKNQDATDIERLEATGKVRIEFDNKVAVSKQAVYIVPERKLVLSGKDSKVISGKDEITGTQITFFRENGNVELKGDDEGQVKAIIHSDQRGLN